MALPAVGFFLFGQRPELFHQRREPAIGAERN